MGYQRFPATGDLAGVIDHVWLLDAPALPSPRREILIPNGRPGIAIALADPGTRHDPITGAEWPNAASVFGVMTRPQVIGQVGTASYAGVELEPWGLSALGLPALIDDVLVGWPPAEKIAVELRARPFGPERAERLMELVGPQVIRRPSPVLVEAVRAIDALQGRVAVEETVRRCGTSYSTLYRVFRQGVGIGPKQYAEIVRYYHFVGGLLGGPADAAATVSALHGYYDQAHAARDFKRYTGVTAREFLAVQNGIAALMHGRSVQDREPPGA